MHLLRRVLIPALIVSDSWLQHRAVPGLTRDHLFPGRSMRSRVKPGTVRLSPMGSDRSLLFNSGAICAICRGCERSYLSRACCWLSAPLRLSNLSAPMETRPIPCVAAEWAVPSMRATGNRAIFARPATPSLIAHLVSSAFRQPAGCSSLPAKVSPSSASKSAPACFYCLPQGFAQRAGQ